MGGGEGVEGKHIEICFIQHYAPKDQWFFGPTPNQTIVETLLF